MLQIPPASLLPICLIAAEFLSQVGDRIAAIAIPILVLQFTHSAIATGIAGAGSIIPIVLAAFVGGRAIDRFGAWRVSFASDLFSSLSVLALPLVFIEFKSVSPIAIFWLVFVGALFDPTAVSARQVLVPKFARLAGISLDVGVYWQLRQRLAGISCHCQAIGQLLVDESDRDCDLTLAT